MARINPGGTRPTASFGQGRPTGSNPKGTATEAFERPVTSTGSKTFPDGPCPGEVGGQRHDARLPYIGAENGSSGVHDDGAAFVEVDPVCTEANHHGADRSIRCPIASASALDARRVPANSASATSCSESGGRVAAA